MEIYKLKDEVPEGRSVRGRELMITDLKQGVKNPNRVNVFVDGGFAFSLDVTQVVEYKLKIGKVLTEEELAECKKASEFGKLYQRALEWVLARPRSEKELENYLFKKVYEKKLDKNYIKTISERLKEKSYVNDRKFAEWWVENRFVNKGVSRKRLQTELMKKGINREIIEEVLEGRDDEEEARKMIAKKQGKYNEPDKLVAYLCRQGFSYDLAKKIVSEVGE